MHKHRILNSHTHSILLAAVVCLLFGFYQTLLADPIGQNFESELVSLKASAKIIDSNDIVAELEQGRDKVNVIINLTSPIKVTPGTFRSRLSRRNLRQKIRKRQEEVMSVLNVEDFELGYIFENQAGFSARMNPRALESLTLHPLVESIEPVRVLEGHTAQGIALIDGLDYRSLYSGQGVAVAICDTGVDYTHPDLGGGGFPNDKVIGGYDFGNNDTNPIPQGNAHGTACAGIAAGDLNVAGDYIGGVAYDAKIYALKITRNTSGSTTTDRIIDAWNWCITHQYDDPNNPIVVISTSFGGERYFSSCDASSPGLATAANNANAAGITVLASSGNDGYCESLNLPSCISGVISVGAVYDYDIGSSIGFCIDPDSCTGENYTSCTSNWACFENPDADIVTCYSNTASFLDILAPSHDASTTDISGTGGYESGDYTPDFGGTSAACPYAAGVVGVIQSAAWQTTGAFLTPQEVKDLLVSTGDLVTDLKVDITKPRVNLGSALDDITGAETPPTAFSQHLTMLQNTSKTITLTAEDEGLPDPPGELTYIVTSLPADGNLVDPNTGLITSTPYVLDNDSNQVIYEPNKMFIGEDEFTFKANDGGSEPNGGDSQIATVSINVTELPEDVYEDFEIGLGNFTIDNSFGNGNGLWHITPLCESAAGGHSGPNSLYYGDDSNDAGMYQCNYDEGDTEGVVNSEIISLVGTKSPLILSFNYYLETEDDSPSGWDVAEVQISQNGGQFVTVASNADETLVDPSGGWLQKEINLSGYIDSTIQLRFKFKTGDSLYNNFKGFYIDDIAITGTKTGDFEPDGDVDFFDYAFFSSAWLTEPPNPNYKTECDIYDPTDNFIDANDLDVFTENWLR